MKLVLDRLLQCAVDTARAAGDHAYARSARRKDVIRTYAHDVKLKLDRESQAAAVGVIRSRFPGHQILGEEDESSTTAGQPAFRFQDGAGPASADGADFLWIVDPIDGTVNFFHGFPLWCSSVALAVRGVIVVGAVYAPAMGLCYTAVAGGPAMCNGKTIGVSGTASLREAAIVTGLDRRDVTGLRSFALFNAMAVEAQKMRILGSAAQDLCAVANGFADGYFEAGIYIWDVAAAGLITRQAGGKAEILKRLPGNRLCFLGTNGRFHGKIRALLMRGLARTKRA